MVKIIEALYEKGMEWAIPVFAVMLFAFACLFLSAIYPFIEAMAFAWKVQAIGEAGINGDLLRELAKVATGVME